MLSVAVFALAESAASAATFTVSGHGDRTGVCSGTTCPSLRAAVNAADQKPGSTVKLGTGSYTLGAGPGRPVGDGQLLIGAGMTIVGKGSTKTRIVQTDGADRVLGMDNPLGAVSLERLTITGGRLLAGASEPGAGIYTVAPLTLRKVTVSGNTETGSAALDPGACCQAVGGIASDQALTLIDSKVTGNSATGSAGASGASGGQAAGGIYATKLQPVTITDSVISNNTATGGAGGAGNGGAGGAGGGAYGGVFVIDGAPLTVEGSTFSGNQGHAGTGGSGNPGGAGGISDGGAIFIPDAALKISDSTFDGNVAEGGAGGPGVGGPGGAGADAYGGAVAGGSRSEANAIVNSTFFANRVEGGAGGSGTPSGAAGVSAGGGIGEDTDFGMALVSSTLDANIAKGPGAAYGGNLFDQFSPITIAQTLFAGGIAGIGPNCEIAAAETDDGHNLETTTPSQCGLSVAQQDVIGATMTLRAPAMHGGPAPTIALPARSPAVGAGGQCRDYALAGNPALRTDERGRRRPVPCDIGAFQTKPKRHHKHG